MDPDLRLARLSAAAAVGLTRLPTPLLRALGGRRPAIAAELDPEAWLLARLSSIAAATVDLQDPDHMRRRFEGRARPLAAPAPVRVAAEDHVLEGPAGPLDARLYIPDGTPRPAPLLVWFHGGGWVQGSIASHDGGCRMLAALAGVRLLSVAYRLAPEHPFPAAADDALAAYTHVTQHAAALGADAEQIAVGGDSAGGNLAAAVALDARDRGLPAPAFQLLVYPALDLTMAQPSVARYAEGFFLTRANMEQYVAAYVPDPAHRTDPRASPLFAPDLAGLPPAHVAVAATDPLRDEGERYAERLRDAGVATTTECHPLLHGFANMTATRSGRRGVERLAATLREGLAQRYRRPS